MVRSAMEITLAKNILRPIDRREPSTRRRSGRIKNSVAQSTPLERMSMAARMESLQ